MIIPVIVTGQRMKIHSIYKLIAPRSQQFVQFVFDLSSDWNGLTVFAQFLIHYMPSHCIKKLN